MILRPNRNRTSVSFNNLAGNSAIGLIANINQSYAEKEIQVSGGQTRGYNITSAVIGINQDGTPRFSGQGKVTQAHYAIASTGTQTIAIEEEWAGSIR